MEAQKQIRENTQELHDFLKDLQDWERTVKSKDEQLRSEAKSQTKQIPPVRKTKADPRNAANHTYDYFKDKWDKFDVDAALKEAEEDEQRKETDVKHSPEPEQEAEEDEQRKETDVKHSPEPEPALRDSFDIFPQRYSSDKSFVADAAAEKEQGNEFFKEKKYVQAIECYSRSIGLHPTAVAYANRAMALLKIRRYEDAEMDCSEAIAPDDRYTKAYARRGTAKERDKLLEAVEDFEFALRLEPHNKELSKQYEETKALYEKKNTFRPAQKKVPLEIQRSKASSSSPASSPAAPSEKIQLLPSSAREKVVNPSKFKAKPEASQDSAKRERRQAVQAAADRAAAAAMSSVAQNMSAPKTSYEFETLWRGFGDDRLAKARLIKLMDPASISRVFRDFLSASLLMDILKTIDSALVEEDPGFSADVLENLTKVGRFTMTVMCLSPNDKSTVGSIFEKLSAIPGEKLKELKTKYRV